MRRFGIPALVTSALVAGPAVASSPPPAKAPVVAPPPAPAQGTIGRVNLAARPLARPLAMPNATPNAANKAANKAPAQAAAAPKGATIHAAGPAPVEAPIAAPVVEAAPVVKIARPIQTVTADLKDHEATIDAAAKAYNAAETQLGKKLATVVKARARVLELKAAVAEAEKDAPGFFANAWTLGGAGKRHDDDLTKLRATLARAEGDVTTAETAAVPFQQKLDAAKTRLKDLQATHQMVVAELAELKANEAAETKLVTQKDHAAKSNQFLVQLVKAGTKTEGYRRAAARARANSFVVDKPRDGGGLTEDAVAMNPEQGLYAIADGVTNATHSGPLARLLVRKFVTAPPKSSEDITSSWLGSVQGDWSKETTAGTNAKNLWFNAGANTTGYATFVGAKLVDGEKGSQLKVMGIGDSVIMVVRGGKIAKSFPLERSEQFTDLVESIPAKGKAHFPVQETTWDVQPDDEVFMATDALGKWIFTEVEAGRDPFPTLRNVKSQDGWSKFVANARVQADGAPMGVDDTSLVRFVVPTKK